jgi:hypothetical protein
MWMGGSKDFGYDLAKTWLPFCFRESLSSLSIWALPVMPLDAVLGQDKGVRRCYQKTLGGGPPPFAILLLLPIFKCMIIFLFSLKTSGLF